MTVLENALYREVKANVPPMSLELMATAYPQAQSCGGTLVPGKGHAGWSSRVMQRKGGNAHRCAGPVVQEEVADGVAAAHGKSGGVERARGLLLVAEGTQVVVLAGLADARLKLAARLV